MSRAPLLHPHALTVVIALLPLAGCANPLKELATPPTLSAVATDVPPDVLQPRYTSKLPSQPISRYSIWDDRSAHLFTARRAFNRGDLLTVEIDISDRANFDNSSNRSRNISRSLDFNGGVEFGETQPSGSGNASIGSGTGFDGTGGTSRSERLQLTVAAVVVEALENGNLLIKGTQEVRVNAELRILTVTGIVRAADIAPNNTIAYERIAEARISYGGRGHISEVQQPPYGQRLLDRVLPF